MNVRADHGRERLWAGTARCFVLAAAGLLIGYLSLAYLVDPYDSGRSRLFSVDAVRPQGSRTAAAVQGRDPAFTGERIIEARCNPMPDKGFVATFTDITSQVAADKALKQANETLEQRVGERTPGAFLFQQRRIVGDAVAGLRIGVTLEQRLPQRGARSLALAVDQQDEAVARIGQQHQ